MSELKLSYEFTMATGERAESFDCILFMEVDGKFRMIGSLDSERFGYDDEKMDAVAKLMCNAPKMQNRVAELEAELSKKINENTSDGYHTFGELYHHRAILFSVICNMFKKRSWKSRKHSDGTMYDGMFIVGIDTPKGSATYHYNLAPYWDMFTVPERENAPEWDGHSPDDSIARIGSMTKLEAERDKYKDTLKIVREALKGGE